MKQNPLCLNCKTPAAVENPRFCRNCGAPFAHTVHFGEPSDSRPNTANHQRPDSAPSSHLNNADETTVVLPNAPVGHPANEDLTLVHHQPHTPSSFAPSPTTSTDELRQASETTMLYADNRTDAGNTTLINQGTRRLDADDAPAMNAASNAFQPAARSRVVISTETSPPPVAYQPPLSNAPSPSATAALVAQPPKAKRASRVLLAVLFIIGAGLAATAGVWFALRDGDTQTANQTSAPESEMPAPAFTPLAEPPTVEARMNEAASLLTQGDAARAVEILRDIVTQDESNLDARFKLGEALELAGNPVEAVAAYTEILKRDSQNLLALQRLALAQAASGSISEAAANFKKLLASRFTAYEIDEVTKLRAAETFKRAGLNDDAQRLYAQLSTSSATEIRAAAQRGLRELTRLLTAAVIASPTPAPTPRPAPSQATTDTQNRVELAAPTPTLARQPSATPTPDTSNLTPRERYERAIQTWRADRAAATREFRAVASQIREANYFIGLSYAEGKDPRTMNRAELLAALQHFQLARNSQFRNQARTYEQRLTAEYDRRLRDGIK